MTYEIAIEFRSLYGVGRHTFRNIPLSIDPAEALRVIASQYPITIKNTPYNAAFDFRMTERSPLLATLEIAR